MAAVLLFILLLTVIALARLVLSAHWPSDIVAGAVVGGAWLGVILLALRPAGEMDSSRGRSGAAAH